MSFDVNQITLKGRISTDVELQTSKAGKIYVKFSLCTNSSKKNSDGKYDSFPSFHNIMAFGQLAEELAADGRKGKLCFIQGELTYNEDTSQSVKRVWANIMAKEGGIIETTERSKKNSPTNENKVGDKSNPNVEQPPVGNNDDQLPF